VLSAALNIEKDVERPSKNILCVLYYKKICVFYKNKGTPGF
jgi:hypothetical protein